MASYHFNSCKSQYLQVQTDTYTCFKRKKKMEWRHVNWGSTHKCSFYNFV